MSWFLLAVLGGLASNVFNIFNRHALKNNGDSSVYAWWFEFLRLIAFSFLFFLHPQFPHDISTVLWLIGLGISEVLSIYFFMSAHQLTELSLSTIVIRLRLIWTPLLALLWLGETLKTVDYIGIFVIFIGVVIAISPRTLKFDKGVITTFISSLILTVLSIFQKKAAMGAITPLVLIAMSLPSVLLLPFIMSNAKNRLGNISRQSISNNIIGTIFNVASMYFLIESLRLESTSKVNTVFQSMMVVSLLFGIIFFHERKQVWQKIIGAGVTILGLIILFR